MDAIDVTQEYPEAQVIGEQALIALKDVGVFDCDAYVRKEQHPGLYFIFFFRVPRLDSTRDVFVRTLVPLHQLHRLSDTEFLAHTAQRVARMARRIILEDRNPARGEDQVSWRKVFATNGKVSYPNDG